MELSNIAAEGLYLSLIISAPILAVSLIFGTVVSILQAATQVQEHTVSFVPKLLAVALTLALTFGWMSSRVVSFTSGLWKSIPQLMQ